jgi:recombinational DNA repair protein RecT
MAPSKEILPATPAESAIAIQERQERDFKDFVFRSASKQLVSIMGTEGGKAAGARVTLAIASTLRTAKKPQDILDCTGDSIINCVTMSALTGLMPGGANAKVYLVPQRPNKESRPELQWRITHRGLCELARRSGTAIMAVPVGQDDRIEVAFGEAIAHEPADITAQPNWETMMGVIVTARNLATGTVIVRAWVPRAVIEARRAKSSNDSNPRYSVWSLWPVEMALGAAIRYCFSRGYIPSEGAELDAALDQEDRPTVIEAGSVERVPARSGRSEPRANQKALPDGGGTPPAYDREPDRQPADYSDLPPEEANPAPQS